MCCQEGVGLQSGVGAGVRERVGVSLKCAGVEAGVGETQEGVSGDPLSDGGLCNLCGTFTG